MKKILSLCLALVIILALAVSPFSASAIITTYGGTIAVLPGNTRSSSPVYNYAWLDNVIVRDDAMAVTSKTIKPVPTDYQGSHTYDEFIKEVEQYTVFFDLNEDTVVTAYSEITNAFYYAATAMGMTDDLSIMREYLTSYGIRLPANETAEDKISIAVVYAALKYDALYVLYEKQAQIPVGTTLDGAVVILLSSLTGTFLPSGIDTKSGMAVNMLKQYVTEFEEIPISQNPEADEVFHWAKILTAAKSGYEVPLAVYTEATPAQKEYVDYAYYASILNTIYDINLNPIYLVIAMQSEDELAVQKLVLQTMLSEKGVAFTYEMSAEELFKLAVEYGCLALEDELYSDVLNYEIVVAEDCEKIWFTPFPLAEQLDGGSVDFVTIKLNDTQVKPNSTTSVDLYPTLRQEKVYLTLTYNDGTRNESAVYEFTVIKDAALNDENAVQSENDMVASVEKFVNTIIPEKDSEAAQKIDQVFSAIDNEVKSTSSAQNNGDVLTTYNVGATAATQKEDIFATTDANVSETSRFDLDYLEELINGVYATDADGNIITTSSIFTGDEAETTQENQSIISAAAEAVKENPEIVVAPTGIITLGSLAGYFLSKKHRDVLPLDEEEEDDEE